MMNTELVYAALRGKYQPPDPTEEDLIYTEFLEPKPVLNPKWNNYFQPHKPLKVTELSLQVACPPDYDPRLRIRFDRVGLSGKISGLRLVSSKYTQEEGMSLTRKMGPLKSSVKGHSGQIPFVPGGIDIVAKSSAVKLHHNDLGLLDIAPGLSRSMRTNSFAVELRNDENISDLLHTIDDNVDETENIVYPDDASGTDTINTSNTSSTILPSSKFNSIDYLLPETGNFVRISADKPTSIDRNWAHLVNINHNMSNFDELVPTPARTWAFELDNFQKEAIYHLEQGNSVFIAAHTSAGKTVIAEYAMSMAAQHMTKCIYTSPIKALSNQKYRDFKLEYDDVGILTGDVQLNPDASTLIMTTEILRSMLYKGADIIRDVEFIIFDEVHYVNDSERGVVWEETIIMLPDHVKILLLSATVPNAFEFANWVGRTKQKDVYVISTAKRPVPLKHNLWLRKNLFEIVDSNRKFISKNYIAAQDLISQSKNSNNHAAMNSKVGGSRSGNSSASGNRNSRGGRGAYHGSSINKQALKRQLEQTQKHHNSGVSAKNDFLDLVEYLRSKKLLPAVVFVFSRKLCEQYSEYLQSVQLNNAKEKSQVYMFMEKAVRRLRKEDQELPQIKMLGQLLQRGIGVHHSGLLPIMKEIVEMLFSKGLVKLLFATETLAMGLNLPTRTVVFSAVQKFDSKVKRFLSPGEYTQMAGRAGRRGLDTVGTVIVMNNSKYELISQSALEHMMLGTPLKLSSQFRLTYNMILSLLRIEAIKVEDVIQQSFSENAQFLLRPTVEKKMIALENNNKYNASKLSALVESLNILDDDALLFRSFAEHMIQYRDFTNEIYANAVSLFPFKFKWHFCLFRDTDSNELEVGWITNCTLAEGVKTVSSVCVSVLGRLMGELSSVPYICAISPDLSGRFKYVHNSGDLKIKAIAIERVELLCQLNSKDLRDSSLKLSNVSELLQEFDFRTFKSVSIISTLMKRRKATSTIKGMFKDFKSMIESSNTFADLIHQNFIKAAGEMEIEKLKSTASLSNTALLPDYEQRINVLKAANYLDENLNVILKGRVACEISGGFELYLTELIMDNFLGSYEPEEIVALLSAFVFEGAHGAEDPISVTPRLDDGKARILELVNYVQNLAIKYQVTLTQDEADFAIKDRFALMQVVYEWARGMTFSEITQLTTVQEGIIVRAISRLDEICRSVKNASRIIGEVDLYDKLSIAQEKIRRDIIFCSSLYL